MTCVSRHAADPAMATLWSSQMLIPPVNPTRPSQTTIFRCVRKLIRPGRKRAQVSGLNHATSAPACRNGAKNFRLNRSEPIASTRSRTSTPARALAQSKSRKRVPIRSGSQM